MPQCHDTKIVTVLQYLSVPNSSNYLQLIKVGKSDAYAEKLTDKQIIKHCSILDGDDLMADKAFEINGFQSNAMLSIYRFQWESQLNWEKEIEIRRTAPVQLHVEQDIKWLKVIEFCSQSLKLLNAILCQRKILPSF